MASAHSQYSVLREIILEHLFIGRLLQRLWQAGIYDAEILRSEFDAGGYDLVLSRGEITRHIQLKALLSGGKRRHFDIGMALAEREAGCVLVQVVHPDLRPDGFLWLGGGPACKLPDIAGYPPTRHTKADSTGTKGIRQAHRRVPISVFERVATIEGIIEKLIGDDAGLTQS